MRQLKRVLKQVYKKAKNIDQIVSFDLNYLDLVNYCQKNGWVIQSKDESESWYYCKTNFEDHESVRFIFIIREQTSRLKSVSYLMEIIQYLQDQLTFLDYSNTEARDGYRYLDLIKKIEKE